MVRQWNNYQEGGGGVGDRRLKKDRSVIFCENADHLKIQIPLMFPTETLITELILMSHELVCHGKYNENISNSNYYSNENMILALAGQFKQLSHEPEKFR